MVQVVRADVVPQVWGTVGHAKGRGAEEAGAEGACVGGWEVRRLGGEEGEGGGEEVLFFLHFSHFHDGVQNLQGHSDWLSC